MSSLLGLKVFFNQLKKSDQNRINAVLQEENTSVKENSSMVFEKVILHSNHSLIENSKANQPFLDESGNYALLFNGQIYNYQDLKNDLLKEGTIFFKTASDTEILLHHLIKHGEEGIKDLDGDFAFAFYDVKEDKLILARDLFGIKPLLYALQEDEIIFASELTPFKHLLSNWEVNNEALNAYFQFTYIPAPHTIIKGVNKLMPGHYLIVKEGIVTSKSYFDLRAVKPIDISYEEATKKVKQKLEDAIIKRLNTNKSIGSFLSGGVDSSIVSQVSSTFLNELDTFSIGFSGNDYFDESPYSQKVAEHIKSRHHLTRLGKEEIVASFGDVLSAFDEPYADSSAVALYFLIQKAKEKVGICLSGDGADEYFAGYNKHKAFVKSQNPGFILKMLAQYSKFIPGGTRRGKLSNKVRQLKKFKSLLDKSWPNTYWSLAEFISTKRRNSLLINEVSFNSSLPHGENDLQSFLMNDLEFILPNDMLKKVDVMARFHNFEVRTPFLDKDLVEFVNSLPEEYKLKGNIGKRILKEAFKKVLPEEVFSRSKRGFEIPLHDWINEIWDEVVQKSWFEKSYLEAQNIFKFPGINQLKKDFQEGKTEEATVTMWAYIVFQNWYQRWTKK